MSDEGVLLSKTAAARVLDATRYTEKVRGQSQAQHGRRDAPVTASKFYARLTEEGTAANAGKYKWKKVNWATTVWADESGATSGTDYTASSYNDAKGLKVGSTDGSIVELEFLGFDSTSESAKPVYKFADVPFKGFRVKCVDDYAHANSYVSVKKVNTSNVVEGDAFDVAIICHTTLDDIFYVVPAVTQSSTISLVQIGYPKLRSQYMVLQIKDTSGLPQGIDWDWLRGHA